MLLIEYIAEHEVYFVTPIVNGKPDLYTDYFFADENEQIEFVNAYQKNSFVATFAYHVRRERRWARTVTGMEVCGG